MTGVIATIPRNHFFDTLGKPLAGGKVYTFLAGTTKLATTYQDQALLTKNENPIRLDANGSCSIWLDPTKSYKFVLKNKSGVTQPGWPVDNISGASNLLSLEPTLGQYTKLSALAAPGGADLVMFLPKGVGGIARKTGEKLREFPSFADKGASSTGDALSAIQTAIDVGFGQIGDDLYLVSAPLKLPSLSAFWGNRAGAAFTGTAANVKRAIRKTTNTPVSIVNFETKQTRSVDCLIYTDPAWIDNGVSYPQRISIERQAFHGNPDNPNFAVLYIEQGSGYALRDLQMSGTVHSIYAKNCWSSVFENIQTTGKIVWEMGGTSCTFTNVGTGAGPNSTGGWSLVGLIYTTFNSCWNDGTTDTGWRLVNCDLTFNSCGIENGTASQANSGTAFAFDGGNKIVLNSFNVVPVKNQVIPPYTVGFDNTITFNQGNSYFPGITGINCPDVFVWGNNSTVIYNDYTFLNGTKNAPLIQFAAGVTTSRVIVNFGSNTKTYTSDGNGNTIASTKNDGGTYPVTMSFGGAAATVTGSGTWRKNDGVVVVSGRITITSKGPGAGQAVIGGWPVFAQVTDAALNMALITSITGGPISGVVDKNNPSLAVLNVRSATGDSAATQANFNVGGVIWFEFSYATD